jgi:ligand-binding sensor domain-containing protein
MNLNLKAKEEKMKKLLTIQNLGIAFMVAAMFLVGCSGDEPKGQSGFVSQVVSDSVNKFVDNVVEASFATAPVPVVVDSNGTVSNVSDMVILDSMLYAVYDGGLVSYDFRNKEKAFIRNGEKLRAIAKYNDKIFVGGDRLYTYVDQKLEPSDFTVDGTIRSLYSDGARLFVGTNQGLYANSTIGMEKLMDDVSVNAIVSDNDGLWVGTDGQGLYHWNGDMFQKRYLLRDTSIFDVVNTIAFNHNHLYVGASTGFFVFNGGRWEQFTSLDGLPDDNVRAIDASSWVVYVGTDLGIVSYFDNSIDPVKRFETTVAAVIRPMGRKLIVGTESEGVVMRAGSFVKTLVEPQIERKEEIFSKSEDETI